MAKKKTPAPISSETAADAMPANRRRKSAAAPAPMTSAEPIGDQNSAPAPVMADPDASALTAAPAASPENGPTYDQIAEAAYLRYLNRGGGDGRDFDDWLAAEQDLKGRG